MRVLAPLVVMLALLIALGLWTNHSLETTARELAREIDSISAEIEQDRWDKAVKKTIQLEKLWDQKARWWPIFLEHQEMDNIEFSLARVKEYVASQNRSLSQGQLSELKLMIEHIPEKEAVTLKNIL